MKATITINGQSIETDADDLARYLNSAYHGIGEARRSFNENTTISSMMTGQKWEAKTVEEEFEQTKKVVLNDLKRQNELYALIVQIDKAVRSGR